MPFNLTPEEMEYLLANDKEAVKQPVLSKENSAQSQLVRIDKGQKGTVV